MEPGILLTSATRVFPIFRVFLSSPGSSASSDDVLVTVLQNVMTKIVKIFANSNHRDHKQALAPFPADCVCVCGCAALKPSAVDALLDSEFLQSLSHEFASK